MADIGILRGGYRSPNEENDRLEGYNEIVITGDHYSKNVYDNESNLLECINRNEKDGSESYAKIENGKTKFYTKDEIPWGTGMVYPPHFQHELRN
ncbi:MAG: hypothetical protein IJN75_00105 [Clostridia bacterium]|nr:hypothetical protein [Clostridia bacterium]